MDLAITIGQGLGFGVACGLSTIALLVPLFWPGIDGRALGALGAPSLVLAAVDLWLPQIVRTLIRIAAGAAACEFWLHDDLVYFTTRSQHPSPDASYTAAKNGLWYIDENATNGTATQVTLNGLPGGNHFYGGDMTFDQSTRQIYLESEDTDQGAGANNDVIYVFQLDATGHSATLINTLSLNPPFTNDAGQFGGLTFAQLASLTVSGTATAVAEQGAAVTLLNAAPTITDDGGYLASATVRVAGGTFVSNESSAADDDLGYGAGMTQSGLIAGTGITLGWSQATGTLTLTGYDTIAHNLSGLSEESIAALTEIVPPFGAVQNPVDITATVLSDPTLFDRSLDVLIADDSVDIIIACFCVMAGPDVEKAVTALSKAARKGGKPILVARTGADFLAPDAPAMLRDAQLPDYPTPARALKAAAALWQVSRPRPHTTRDALAAPLPAPAPQATEPQLKELLATAGIAVPKGRIAQDADDAATLVRELGGRAVLKAVVPGLLHKSEAGGVRVGVTGQEAAAAFGELAALGGEVLVEELAADGVEALVGVRTSPLGTVLTVGLGGIFTEILDDVAHGILPLADGEAETMISELRGAALLRGARGTEAVDAGALADLLYRLSDAVRGWPGEFELDLNPVRVLPSGAVVLDAAFAAGDGPAR